MLHLRRASLLQSGYVQCTAVTGSQPVDPHPRRGFHRCLIVVSFSVRTFNGTALAGRDFDAKTGNRTIAAGKINWTIQVQRKADDRDDGQEQFRPLVNARSDNAVNGNILAIGTIDELLRAPL